MNDCHFTTILPQRIFVFACILLSSIGYTEINAKQIEISFNEYDFRLNEDTNGFTRISTDKYPCSFPSDTLDAALPWIEIKVQIPSDSIIRNVIFTPNMRLLPKRAAIPCMPAPAPTSVLLNKTYIPNIPKKYVSSKYPATCGILCGTGILGAYRYASLLISPFQYEPDSGNLYFADKIQIDFELGKTDNAQTGSSPVERRLLDDFCIASSDAYAPFATASIQGDTPIYPDGNYLIITSNSLAQAFQKLIDWKSIKGFHSEIVTVETINSTYSGTSLPLKIKECIKQKSETENFSYILLGGDDTIVPAVGCYGKVIFNDGPLVDKKIPCDLFYACMSGQFDWDKNRNGILGETSDGIDMTPSVFLSRLPIRTAEEAVIYIDNLISYECNPSSFLKDKAILMSGVEMFFKSMAIDGKYKSDAELYGDHLFNTSIKPFSDCRLMKFYDYFSDVPGLEDEWPNFETLPKALSMGYPFVSIFTHGSPSAWGFNGSDFYTDDVSEISASNWSIITTIACNTNAFDSAAYPDPAHYAEPCLSETFIRSPNTKVLAYLGCSREGIAYVDSEYSLWPSGHYNDEFYRRLFSSEINGISFGELVTKAKMNYIGSSINNELYRWIQFGLNPMGDPEMPVYKEIPDRIKDVSIKYENSSISVNLSDNESIVTFTELSGDRKKTYFREFAQTSKFENVGNTGLVCISKQGCIPLLCPIVEGVMYLQNMETDSSCSFESDKIVMGANVTDIVPKGEFVAKSGKVSLKAKEFDMQPRMKVELGAELNTTIK